ncbi:MAG: roadblock/LC7 domain-containing protein [Acidiferrobacter sp.]
MNGRAIPPELMAAFDEEIRQLHARVSGVIGCVLATTDGRRVSAVVDNEADPQRISAMVGSIVALGETIGREVMIGRTQFVAVSAVDGMILLQKVPAKRDLLVVGTLARRNTNLGILLHETGIAAESAARTLDEWLGRNQSPA